MIKTKCLIFILIYFSFSCFAQKQISDLQKFNDITLFNTQDFVAVNLSGEWFGEEIQYDPTQSFIKVKFKIIFKLKQEGNRVYGTSYIEDKYRGSYGDMKIRGIIIGNKLHFEEYEILDEKFYEPGFIWCLRSGELSIKENGANIVLEGIDYSGYASDNYSKCTDYVTMSITKPNGNKRIETDETNNAGVKIIAGKSNEISVFPNPVINEATITYTLFESSKVQIDIFTLNGTHLKMLLEEHKEAGNYKQSVQLSEYAAGVYLIRFLLGNVVSTKQIVKTR